MEKTISRLILIIRKNLARFPRWTLITTQVQRPGCSPTSLHRLHTLTWVVFWELIVFFSLEFFPTTTFRSLCGRSLKILSRTSAGNVLLIHPAAILASHTFEILSIWIYWEVFPGELSFGLVFVSEVGSSDTGGAAAALRSFHDGREVVIWHMTYLAKAEG